MGCQGWGAPDGVFGVGCSVWVPGVGCTGGVLGWGARDWVPGIGCPGTSAQDGVPGWVAYVVDCLEGWNHRALMPKVGCPDELLKVECQGRGAMHGSVLDKQRSK